MTTVRFRAAAAVNAGTGAAPLRRHIAPSPTLSARGVASVPFTFVVVGVAWCWVKALREETAAPEEHIDVVPDPVDATSDDAR